MKSLEEKRLLVKMARAFNQPVDPKLEESIRLEEELIARLFKKPAEPPVQILAEEKPKPAETNIVPAEKTLIQQSVAAISDVKFAKPTLPDFQQKELDGLRKSIAEIMQKMGTLSWGGAGTGVVKINDTDDFDKSSYADGRYLQWTNGMFRLAEVNPHDVVFTTTLVTSPTYAVTADDYYVGVNYAGPCTITLPASPSSGREVAIKDESGSAEANPITVVGNVDNDAGGFILAVNNGAVQLIYRNGWRII